MKQDLRNLNSSLLYELKGFGIVNKAEIDVFLECSCFFHDPADVGNLISGSSVFSKTSLNIWKFTIHVLLKPGLENFVVCSCVSRRERGVLCQAGRHECELCPGLP